MTKDELLIAEFWACFNCLEIDLNVDVNHSATPDKEIAINLNEFIKKNCEHGTILNFGHIDDIRRLLPYSQSPKYKFSGPIYSKLEKRTIQCWVFER